MTASFNQIEKLLTLAPVVPVLTVHDPKTALPMAMAMARGGLKALEVTLRTKAALEVISIIAREAPEVTVGAGTVLNPSDIDAVAKAGGKFCVSPGSSPALLQRAKDAEMKLLPGAATATEVMNLLDQDISYMKFFPADAAGGIPLLKGLGGPIPSVKFCPTGGVNLSNAPDYLALSNVICVGGTWVCPPTMLRSHDWRGIEALAVAAAALKPREE